jgi:thiol-disulfide isomerase/thioredoxin
MVDKRSVVSVIFSILLLASCKQELTNISTSLSINFANTELKDLVIFNITKEVFEIADRQNNNIPLNIEEEMILELSSGRRNAPSYVFVKPGMQLEIDTISSKPLILGYIGGDSRENAYLIDFVRNDINLTGNKSDDLYSKESVDFLAKLDEFSKPLNNFIQKIDADTQVSKTFKSQMKLRATIGEMSKKLDYLDSYRYLNKKEPALPEDYYAEMELIDLSNPELLTFQSGRNFVERWPSKNINYAHHGNLITYYDAINESTQKAYGNTLMGQYCSYRSLSNQINFGSGIDLNQNAIEQFNTNNTNKTITKLMLREIGPWLKLKSGMSAPDFIVQNREGEDVSLKDLKGKKIYIDVWATWCAPCIAEIPSLKQLEKDLLNEDIAFVSISVDNKKDIEKWKKFIERKELGGTQLMANGEFQSDLTKNYNITGIPHFLLLSGEGKIISANALKPSNPKIRALLLK